MILLDTNILIEAMKRDVATITRLSKINSSSLIVSSVVVAELYQGAVNKQELLQLGKEIKAYQCIELDEHISELAVKLIYDYSLSHNLKLPDALIAATAILTGFELFTYNEKDFRYIQGVKLYEYR